MRTNQHNLKMGIIRKPINLLLFQFHHYPGELWRESSPSSTHCIGRDYRRYCNQGNLRHSSLCQY